MTMSQQPSRNPNTRNFDRMDLKDVVEQITAVQDYHVTKGFN